jgi:hypothetical protein
MRSLPPPPGTCGDELEVAVGLEVVGVGLHRVGGVPHGVGVRQLPEHRWYGWRRWSQPDRDLCRMLLNAGKGGERRHETDTMEPTPTDMWGHVHLIK